MINKFLKIIKHGYDLFEREKIVSTINVGTTILVSLFIWSGILGFYFLNQLIIYFQERLDFSIYFKNNVERENIVQLKKILENFPGVSGVEFIPQEVAFKKFKEESKSNPVIAKALNEIRTNPLVDYLIIKANDSETYLKIADYIEKSPYKAFIEYITYSENQNIIKRIISLSNQVRIIILGILAIILIFSCLIIFNTVLVSIYTQKEYVEVLRLIGAGNWFIRGPFLINILIFSFIGYLIALSFLILFLMKTENFWSIIIPNFQPSKYLMDNFLFLNSGILGIILFINIFSTFIALQKYLRI